MSDREALARLQEEMIAALNARDADRVAELYTEDAVYMPPGAPAVVGREAIRSTYQTDFDRTRQRGMKVEVETSIAEIVITGDWAFLRAAYKSTLTFEDHREAIRTTGKLLGICHHDSDGRWRRARQIRNPDGSDSLEDPPFRSLGQPES